MLQSHRISSSYSLQDRDHLCYDIAVWIWVIMLPAQVWDATTRRCLFSMSSHTLAISCVKWGGDGLIYSSSRDCSINVWDAKARS